MEKICTTCRVDVSDAPELKDEEGNFYCQACADAANQAADEAEAASAFVNPAPVAMPDDLRGLAYDTAAQQSLPVTDTARAILEKIKDDRGPFQKIANESVIVGTPYLGYAYISPTAVYLFKTCVKTKSGAPMALGAQFGLAGALAGALIEAGKQSGTTPPLTGTCLLQDLPAHIRQEFDPKNDSPRVNTVILLREAASSIALDGKFLIIVERGLVYELPLVGKSEIVRRMQEMGWEFVSPSDPEAAAHDARLIKIRAPKRRMSPALKWTLIIVILFLIFDFIFLAMHSKP